MCCGAEGGDQIELLSGNIVFFADPASADGMNKRGCEELCHVLRIDTAGWNELEPDEGT